MEELRVIVQQQPGQVSWNFEDLKKALAEKLEQYSEMVYGDDSIKSAKDDLKNLRKLVAAVEEKRKEVKNRCLEPYAVIELQAKQLTDLINKPIDVIDKQVKDYEAKQRAIRKGEIMNFMSECFKALPTSVAERLRQKIYNPKWENATAKKKDWKDAIQTACAFCVGDIKIIDGVEEEFRQQAMNVYQRNLVLSEALDKVEELRRQKAYILEVERRRREEERRKAEAPAPSTPAVSESEALPQEAPRSVAQRLPQPQEVQPKAKYVGGHRIPACEPQPWNQQQESNPARAAGRTITISCNDEQFRKIAGYIRYVGASFVEVGQ